MCGGGGGTNLQAGRRHSQYEKHNVAGMTERGENDVKHVCVQNEGMQSDFPPQRDSSVDGMTDDADTEEGGGKRSSDG